MTYELNLKRSEEERNIKTIGLKAKEKSKAKKCQVGKDHQNLNLMRTWL